MTISLSEQFFRDLSCHYQATRLAKEDPQMANGLANQITHPGMRDKAKSKIVTIGLACFHSDPVKMQSIVAVLQSMQLEYTRSKCADRLLAKVVIPEVEAQFSLSEAVKRKEFYRLCDESKLSVFTPLLAKGQFSNALSFACLFRDAAKRAEAFQEVAKKLPKEFRLPNMQQNPEEEKRTFTDLVARVGTLSTYMENCKLLKAIKWAIVFAAASGNPQGSLELAAIARQKLEAAAVESGLRRAGEVTAVYDKAMADKIVKEVRI